MSYLKGIVPQENLDAALKEGCTPEEAQQMWEIAQRVGKMTQTDILTPDHDIHDPIPQVIDPYVSPGSDIEYFVHPAWPEIKLTVRTTTLPAEYLPGSDIEAMPERTLADKWTAENFKCVACKHEGQAKGYHLVPVEGVNINAIVQCGNCHKFHDLWLVPKAKENDSD
jgi:hypothetical protein